jgi:hypothetical protein
MRSASSPMVIMSPELSTSQTGLTRKLDAKRDDGQPALDEHGNQDRRDDPADLIRPGDTQMRCRVGRAFRWRTQSKSNASQFVLIAKGHQRWEKDAQRRESTSSVPDILVYGFKNESRALHAGDE